jgi:flagellar protein FlgJ
MEMLTHVQQPAKRSLEGHQENPSVDDEKSKIEKACRDFESLFVMHMMKQMRKTVPQDGLFSGGSAEKMYSSMLDGEIAKSVSEQRGIGLAPALIRQLMELSGNEENTP